nr:hypothetical protein [Tanacetum cinerariifolium]
MHTPAPSRSEAQNGLPDSILSIGLALELSSISYLKPRVDKHNLLRGGISVLRISSLQSTGAGMYRGGGSGGDGHAAVTASINGFVHLAKRSPTEGGDSEASGNGGRVGIAGSLSTSASSRKDMAA